MGRIIARLSSAILLAYAVFGAVPATAQSSASGFTTGYRYDVDGNVTGVISPDPDGTGPLHHAAVRNTYDVAGRLIRFEKGELASWQAETVAPANWSGFTVFSKVETSYDARNRKALETASGWDIATSAWVTSGVTQYSYTSRGQLECTAVRMNPATYGALPSSACSYAATSSLGPDRITRNIYDAAGQLLKVQKAYGITTANGFPETLQQDYATYTYSPNGERTSVTDANGNKASMTYDAYDRQVRWNFPDKNTVGTVSTTDYEEYAYDANSNRTSLRKRDGAIITYRYDALNRVVQKRVPDPAGGTAATSTTNCQAGTSLSNASDTNDVCYSYDLRGLQTAAQFGWLGGPGLASAYDGFGRLTGSTNTMGGTTRTLGYQWNEDGQRTQVTHPDGNYFVYAYDGLDRMEGLLENGSAQIATISYNPQGGRARVAKSGVITDYTYDPVSRLASISDDLANTASDLTSTFSYSPASQIVSRTRSNSAYAFTGYVGVSRSYTRNGLNQYTTAGAATFSYDANGNLTGDGGSTFGYDAENRLISASGAVSATLTYDPMGRLFSVGPKQFLYDGDELIGEYDSATPTTINKRYVHGPDEDDPWFWYGASVVSAGLRRSLQTDHQGSVVSLANSSGAMMTINTYDEYGIPGGSNLGRFQYTGQVWLPEIGMYYYKARIYSPTLGRFLQTDPIGYQDQINLYTYVGNDPVDERDPTGLCVENTCPVSGFWGSTKYNLQVRRVEGEAGKYSLPGFVVASAIPLAYVALDALSVNIGVRAFQATRSAIGAAERAPMSQFGRTATNAINKIRTIIAEAGKRNDFVGAARESRGIKTGWDHVTEMRNSINGLRNSLKSIEGSLNNPNLSASARQTLQAWRTAANTAIENMKRALGY